MDGEGESIDHSDRRAEGIGDVRDAMPEPEKMTDILDRKRANANYAAWLTGFIFFGVVCDLIFPSTFIRYIREMLGIAGVVAAFAAFPLVMLRRWLIGRAYDRALSAEMAMGKRLVER